MNSKFIDSQSESTNQCLKSLCIYCSRQQHNIIVCNILSLVIVLGVNEWACRLWSVLWQIGLAQPFKIYQLSSIVAICKCCCYRDRLIPQFVPCMSDADVDQTHSRKCPLCISCLVPLKHDRAQWKCQFGPLQRWEKENIYLL